MNREQFTDAILALPVWDTHTHLNNPGVPVSARDFCDIGHYFWFRRELTGAGYPQDADKMPLERRAGAFAEAFDATGNTAMNWVVRRIMRDLYSLEITDAQSVLAAEEAVKESFARPAWPGAVIDRMGIRRITVNSIRRADLPHLEGVGCAVPIIKTPEQRIAEIAASSNPAASARKRIGEIADEVRRCAAAGAGGVRVDPGPFERLGARACELADTPLTKNPPEEHVRAVLLDALFEALGQRGMFAQLFLGIRRTVGDVVAAVPDPDRVVNLHALFDRRANCGFELVMGCQGDNLDAVHAARVFSNVHVGGMWWFNFRPSTYRQSLSYRLEALPASRSVIVASDARCIEWCYGKILLIKHLVAEVLWRQIRDEWIDEQTALHAARMWLHDSAAARYEDQRR